MSEEVILLHNNDSNNGNDSYTLKPLCNMVANEALKKLIVLATRISCWPPNIAVYLNNSTVNTLDIYSLFKTIKDTLKHCDESQHSFFFYKCLATYS